MTWRHHTQAHPGPDYHVWPEQDVIDHDLEGVVCICGPTTEQMVTATGDDGLLVIHHSLDNRETRERQEAAHG